MMFEKSAVIVGILIGSAILCACSFLQDAKKPTCQVVDALHEACTLVKFMGDDGKEHVESVPASEVAALGARRAGVRVMGSKGDAGCQ